MQGVAQLHSGALAALAAHDGLVATGSADRLLRLWGGDLQHACMEAQHEGPVTGAGWVWVWGGAGAEAARAGVALHARCAVPLISPRALLLAAVPQALPSPQTACAWRWARRAAP